MAGKSLSVAPGKPRYRLRALLLLTLVVAVEAAILLPQIPGGGPMGGDAREYDALARNLAERHCYSVQPDCQPATLRTPGYPLFLAAVYEAGGGPRAVRAVQFALLALTAFLVFETTAAFFAEGTALLAGLLCATFLPLALSALYQMPETAATAAAVATAWAASRLPGWKWAVAFGALGGAAYLVRPTLVLLPAGLGIALLVSRRAPLRHLAVAGFACFAVLAPMVARNSAVEHRFALVGSPPGWSVYISALQWQGRVTYHLTAAPFLPLTQERERQITELHRTFGIPASEAAATVDGRYLQQGLREYARIPLRRFVAGWPVRMFHFWGPEESSLGLAYAFLIAPVQWLAMVGFALLGLWRERRRAGALALLWVPVACLSLFHSFFHVEPRYALMGWPFVLVFSAAGLAAVAGRFQRTKRGAKAFRAAPGESQP